MTNAILVIIGFLILLYYTKSELKILIEEKKEPLKEPEPLPQTQTIQAPEKVPEIPIIQEPPKMGRRELEQAARNCLTAAGCKFDVYDYTRYKSDVELMDIIKDYNLNK